MSKILFMPTVSDIEVIVTPVEMSNEGFDYENIAKSVLVYIVTCLPSGVPSILADMLDNYINASKYRGDGYEAYMQYLQDTVKEKLV